MAVRKAKRRQIAALKFLIFRAKDGTLLAKRLATLLIEESNRLTRSVCITLTVNMDGFSADELKVAGQSFHRMLTAPGTTDLNQYVQVTGTGFRFSHRMGNRNGRPSNGQTIQHTFWFSRRTYAESASRVIMTRAEIEKIDLSKHGLYSRL